MTEKEIVIRLKIPTFPRARWLLAIVVAVIAVGAVAYAADFTPFAAGEQLGKAKMNLNFQTLQDRIVALESGRFVATIGGKKYSVGGTKFVGATAAFDGAQVGGYNGAKAKCEAATTSVSAHMCSGEEIIRSMATSITVGSGWISLGNVALGGGSAFLADCIGWTVNSSANLGTTWAVTNSSDSGCNAATPILCCD